MLTIGTLLGPYEIQAAIGAGGMGEVWKARDTKLNRDVALKVLPERFAVDPQRLARFKREARILATLNHPNIGAVYGLEEANDGRQALVLELVEGATLADRIAKGPVRVDEALAIARQIADALENAHAHGIIHRDLKPSNIKLRRDGTVKVLDFGLAKALDPDAGGRDTDAPTVTVSQATESGVLLGTAAYMSPEQASGDAVDKQADIWAFGCVVFELLTGTSAFRRETVSGTLAAVLAADPPWASLPAAIPAPIRRLLQRCLERDAKQRLKDIGDARLEIEDAASGGTVESQQPPIAVRSRRMFWGWPVAGAVIAAVTVLVGSGRIEVSTPDRGPRFSRIVRLTTGPAREWAPAISPDGKWVAYLSNARGPTDVWVKFVAGGEAANLTEPTGLEVTPGTGIGGMDISPDGTRIAIMARIRGSPTQFETWEIPAPLPGPPQKLLDPNLVGLRWSPDGSRITYIRSGGNAGDALWVANADGTGRREIIKLEAGRHIHWPTWSEDGYVYFIDTFVQLLNMEPSGISRINPDIGVIEPVVTASRRAIFPLPMPDGNGLLYAANPTTAELGLWWRSNDGKTARQLTWGIGEYAEPRISADGRILVGTLYDVQQSLIRISTVPDVGSATALTEGSTGDLDPSVSLTSERLVFSSSRSGNRHLWTSRLDGTDARPLTSGTSLDERPAVSPDGTQIAFVSDREGQRAIWLMNPDGGTPRKLADAAAIGGLSWSRDSREIAFAAAPAGDRPGLWVVSVGDGRTRHVPTPGTEAVGEPAWSPTRDVIAYVSVTTSGPGNSRLAFVDPSGAPVDLALPTRPEELVGGFQNGTLAWAPDGRRLAAVTQGTAGVSIWIVEIEGATAYRKVIDISGGPRLRGVTWTRDGSAIIVGKHDVSSSDIVMMDAAP